MPIYSAISQLCSNYPKSEQQAQSFLSTLTPQVQEQLICAIYLGRDHLHSAALREDCELSRASTDHIPAGDYAQIVFEKGDSGITYLKKLTQCAAASGFDLNSL
ncbi:hypothetical protein MASR2M32_29770 [Sphaerotilus sulfidivorans]